MADKTGIEWCDATWNPIRGCSLVSAGCTNCYAMGVAGRFGGAGQPYEGLTVKTTQGAKWTGKIMLVPDMLNQPLRWQKPRRIFVNSMSDLFHEGVPDDYIRAVFTIMATARQHTFQVLTKRPERMRDLLTAWEKEGLCLREGHGVRLPNVWLGVSVEDQESADQRIPILLQTPAAIRWLSMEPLLGPVDINQWLFPFKSCGDCPCPNPEESKTGLEKCCKEPELMVSAINWVVDGGESGPKGRPAHPDWFRSNRDQCAAAGVPYLHKQNGEWEPDWNGAMTCNGCGATKFDAAVNTRHRNAGGEDECGHCGGSQWNDAAKPLESLCRVGKKTAGRLLDGKLHDGYPAAVTA